MEHIFQNSYARPHLLDSCDCYNAHNVYSRFLHVQMCEHVCISGGDGLTATVQDVYDPDRKYQGGGHSQVHSVPTVC